MSTFAEKYTKAIRLAILLALQQDTDYTLNDSVLQMALDCYGNNIGRDRLRTELNWLQEQGLLSTKAVGDYIVATLNARGADVAEGRVDVPGVKRPGPRG